MPQLSLAPSTRPTGKSQCSQSTGSSTFGDTTEDSTLSFVEHNTRLLKLPEAAQRAISGVVAHLRKEQIESGQDSGVKLSTICAAATYFVCQTGTTLQKLAQQQQQHTEFSPVKAEDQQETKRIKDEETDEPPRKRVKKEEKFDAMKDDALIDPEMPSVEEIEAARSWSAWAQHEPWKRGAGAIEESFGVASSTILDHWKKKLFPRRAELLGVLKDLAPNEKGSKSFKYLFVGYTIQAAAALMTK